MFSPALGRAVRSTNCIAATPVCSIGRPVAALGAIPQTLSRPSHQRRLSSSKASIPPDSSNGSNTTQQTPRAGASKAPARKPTGRAGKKRATAEPSLNVPHVPPTDYLQKPVKISSFFSLHRPMSITAAIPPVSTSATFDSIFKGQSPHNKKAMMDNIQTLAGGITQIEAVLRGLEQKQAPEEVIQPEVEVQHLDGPPQSSIDSFMASLLPFRPPPAPTPINEASQAVEHQAQEAAIPATATQQRFWSTAVVVTESIDASGQRTYSATTEPMVEITQNGQETNEMEIRQPFLERMRQRQDTYDRYLENKDRPRMFLISVKRQRKLKMKKHKYKKLMKRTRLLRRKLDRL
ncbi:hypothetical protein BDV96DRAFT_6875 [Lophiotrema nucula]|uniref:Small ribosomal subunit protein mS38 n=1 Tax=Lophiotrema nucula TaxID=690887 RepID=A0A6A5ZWN5_9PLEO|nr:hypothetical protein BDV96DRAFT_6875 [Lophiotrema nucula]